MDFSTSLIVAASGLRAQSDRMKTIAENLANANSGATTPGGDPYRRKIPTMTSEFDREVDATLVTTGKPITDNTDFTTRYKPGNPMADAKGYVKLPNVNTFIEVMDMREAEHSYSANLSVMQATRSMLNKTIDLLK